MPGPAQPRSVLPWTFLGLAVVALLVIVVAQRSGSTAPTPAMNAPFAGGGGGAAPDISSMSPRERASRLFNKIMQLSSEGKQDSVAFFAPMALSAYEMLGDMDADLRYDYGRIAEVSGNLAIAQAEADTLLRDSPNHLLGLILASRVAGLKGDGATQQALEKRLLASEASEKKKGLPEYELHANDIEAAVVQAASARKP